MQIGHGGSPRGPRAAGTAIELEQVKDSAEERFDQPVHVRIPLFASESARAERAFGGSVRNLRGVLSQVRRFRAEIERHALPFALATPAIGGSQPRRFGVPVGLVSRPVTTCARGRADAAGSPSRRRTARAWHGARAGGEPVSVEAISRALDLASVTRDHAGQASAPAGGRCLWPQRGGPATGGLRKRAHSYVNVPSATVTDGRLSFKARGSLHTCSTSRPGGRCGRCRSPRGSPDGQDRSPGRAARARPGGLLPDRAPAAAGRRS